MTYRRRFLGIVLSLAVVNIGCGAMFNSSTTLVRVNVAPPGARIYVDGLYVAQAPGAVNLTNSESHSIELDAQGYERQGTRIESQTSAGYVVLDCVLLVFLILPRDHRLGRRWLNGRLEGSRHRPNNRSSSPVSIASAAGNGADDRPRRDNRLDSRLSVRCAV